MSDDPTPVHDTIPAPAIIPAGGAEAAVLAALKNIENAVATVAAVAHAIARQLDATTRE